MSYKPLTLLLIAVLSLSFVYAYDFNITTTADFDAGDKGSSTGNYLTETYTDNYWVTDGTLSIANKYSDRFTFDDADGFTWKWISGNDAYWGDEALTDATVEITDNTLILTDPGDSNPNYMLRRLSTNLTGDFVWEIKINSSNTALNGISKGLAVQNELQNDFVYLEYSADGPVEKISGGIFFDDVETDVNDDNPADLEGLCSFKFVRDGSNITVYYDQHNNGTWTTFLNDESWTAGDVHIKLWTTATTPDAHTIMYSDFEVTSGILGDDSYRETGNWISANQTINSSVYLNNMTITFTGINATEYITNVEWYLNDTLIADNITDITSGTSIVYDAIANTNFTNITGGNLTIKLYLTGDGTGTPIVSEISGYYIISTPADTTAPSISVVSPTNTTYTTTTILFNVTVDEAFSCWYTLDNGISNVTMTNTSVTSWNATNTSMTQGQFNVSFYCNDTLGNINTTGINQYFFVDSIAPNMAVVSPTNTTYSGTIINFNVTSDASNSCYYTLDEGINNVSMTDLGGGTSWGNINSTMTGNTSFNVVFYCNDSYGNLNNTLGTYFFMNNAPYFYNITYNTTSGDSTSPIEAGSWLDYISVNITDIDGNQISIPTIMFYDADGSVISNNGSMTLTSGTNISGIWRWNDNTLLDSIYNQYLTQYNFTIYMTDNNNRTNSTTTYFNVSDTVVPVITEVESPICTEPNNTALMSWFLTENYPNTSYASVTHLNGSIMNTTTRTDNDTLTGYFMWTTQLGTYNYTVYAIDDGDNEAVKEYYTIYQETANATDCASNYCDGDWTSGLSPVSAANEINYTKPSYAIGAVWQTRDYAGYHNMTIPETCLFDNVNLYMSASNDFGITTTRYYCVNATPDYELLYQHTGTTLYEEGLYWNTSSEVTGQFEVRESCGGSTSGDDGIPEYVNCTIHPDCNDSNNATIDLCVEGICVFKECSINTDCDDGNTSNWDMCVDWKCVYEDKTEEELNEELLPPVLVDKIKEAKDILNWLKSNVWFIAFLIVISTIIIYYLFFIMVWDDDEDYKIVQLDGGHNNEKK